MKKQHYGTFLRFKLDLKDDDYTVEMHSDVEHSIIAGKDEYSAESVVTIHKNGLVLLADSKDSTLYSNRKPIHKVIEGKNIITFENE